MDLRFIVPQSLPPSAIPNHPLSRTKLPFQFRSRLRPSLLPPAASIPRIVRIGTPFLTLTTATTLVRNCCADDQNTPSEEIHLHIVDSKDGGVGAEIADLQLETKFDPSSLWNQMKQIVMFAGPVIGMWICGPLMSLIDTIVIGQSSTMELAALGPGTVVSDYLGYLFMFLSIATSNMVATSLAKKDKDLAQHQISILMFIALNCGVGMFLFTKFLGTTVLSGFVGLKNSHLIPAASTYIQIRSFAWPAVLVGMVCQSASLGMKNSLGPLKALAVASAVNGLGDIILCSIFGFGIAGAAWATMVSQIVAAFMMIQTLNKAGFNAFSLYAPSAVELFQIIELAAPVFLITTSKVVFYSMLTYFTTAMGTITIASHQVMINLFMICSLWGEPLSQTAQSFMPEMIYGMNRSLEKARMLLKSLVIIGFFGGLISGTVATLVALFFPGIFTTDGAIVKQMHKVLLPFFMALTVIPSTLTFEGTLLSGRELGFLSLSMTGCFGLGGLLLMLVCNRGGGLTGCWCVLAGFQWARFSLALLRLTSPQGMLYSEEFYKNKHLKV